MKAQYENKVVSSFLLWFDHTLLDKGEAFTNFGSRFFDVATSYYNYETFGAPYKQFVSDSSIANADIISGLYVSGTAASNFREVGVGGLEDINFNEGHAYFDHDVIADQISGNYAVKEFNVYLTNKIEQDILFESKISLRNKTSQTVTGLAPNISTYPAVFIKNNGGSNTEFSFGGEEMTRNEIRAIVLADSNFSLDAVCSRFQDTVRENIKLIEESDYPFNALGGLKNGASYNYNNLISTIAEEVYIDEVDVTKYDVGYMDGLTNANPEVHSAIIDFELNAPRHPRQ